MIWSMICSVVWLMTVPSTSPYFQLSWRFWIMSAMIFNGWRQSWAKRLVMAGLVWPLLASCSNLRSIMLLLSLSSLICFSSARICFRNRETSSPHVRGESFAFILVTFTVPVSPGEHDVPDRPCCRKSGTGLRHNSGFPSDRQRRVPPASDAADFFAVFSSGCPGRSKS